MEKGLFRYGKAVIQVWKSGHSGLGTHAWTLCVPNHPGLGIPHGWDALRLEPRGSRCFPRRDAERPGVRSSQSVGTRTSRGANPISLLQSPEKSTKERRLVAPRVTRKKVEFAETPQNSAKKQPSVVAIHRCLVPWSETPGILPEMGLFRPLSPPVMLHCQKNKYFFGEVC
jgi:hypothetical protein